MDCNQQGCKCPAAYRFTWPGDDEVGVCEDHAPKMRTIANAIGLHLQLIPILPATAAKENDDARRPRRRGC